MNPENDIITPFFFANSDVRGALVKMGNSFVESLNGHSYPNAVHALLGECLAAATHMTTHLKTPARLTLQARGDSQVNLLMAEAVLLQPAAKYAVDSQEPHQTVRAFARYDTGTAAISPASTLAAMLGRGQLAITLEPDEGQRYQGIVSADEDKLETCIEAYFQQSEQLETTLRLATSGDYAVGLLVQRLPSARGNTADQSQQVWEELAILAQSIQDAELLELPARDILHRLFHQHDYQMGSALPLAFSCSCSQQRTGQALLQVDAREIAQILQEDGEIVMDCEFCSARYRFDRAAIDQLSVNQDATRH